MIVSQLDYAARLWASDKTQIVRLIACPSRHLPPGRLSLLMEYALAQLVTDGVPRTRILAGIGPTRGEFSVTVERISTSAALPADVALWGPAATAAGLYDTGRIGAYLDGRRWDLASDGLEVCKLEVVNVPGFAAALRATPTLRGIVVRHDGARGPGRAGGVNEVAAALRRALDGYGLDPGRVAIRFGRRSRYLSADLRLVSGSADREVTANPRT